MQTIEKFLESNRIKLRALEPSDIDLLYDWENDTNYWRFGSTLTPFSKKALQDYIENSSFTDIYEAKQLRLMIVEKTKNETIGSIDLYDFNAHNRRAGIGILITEKYQNNGYATDALETLLNYCKSTLLLKQVFADIQTHNTQSLSLFEHAGFEKIGIKKEWIVTADGSYEDVVLLQKILR